jgi:hypothetical protein
VDTKQELDALSGKVERQTDVEGGVKTLVSGVAGFLKDRQNDPAQIGSLATLLDGGCDAWASAVVQNTVAET